MPMSQIGFVLYNYVYSALAVVVLSVALWAVFVVNRKRNHALILTGVVVGKTRGGAQYVFRGVENIGQEYGRVDG
jgi:uncharacterized membrane protein YqiK